MRKILLLTALSLPLITAPVWAAAPDPTDPNYEAFKDMKQQVEQMDSAGVTLPDGQKGQPKFLQKALAQQNAYRSGGCNPVAMASLQYAGMNATIQEVAKKSEVYNSINVKDTNCGDLMGRTKIAQDVEKLADNADISGIISQIAGLFGMNPGTVETLASNFGIQLDPKAIIMAQYQQMVDSQCYKFDTMKGNAFQEMGGDFGASLMTQLPDQAFTVKYNNGSAKPPGNGNGNNGTGNAVRLRTPVKPVQQSKDAAAPAQQQQEQKQEQKKSNPLLNIFK